MRTRAGQLACAGFAVLILGLWLAAGAAGSIDPTAPRAVAVQRANSSQPPRDEAVMLLAGAALLAVAALARRLA